MKQVLITGATGNVGSAVVRFLYKRHSTIGITAAVRDEKQAQELFADFPGLGFVRFDYENHASYDKALHHIDCVFLMIPPHTADVQKFIQPFLYRMQEKDIRQVVFLSVQGAEKFQVLPHNKVERMIQTAGLEYIFLRPGYYMQNLTTVFANDIRYKRKIGLPAGKTGLNWVDIENIGETGAILIEQFQQFKNRAIEITGTENHNFYKAIDIINHFIPDQIKFERTNPFWFYLNRRKDKMPAAQVIVMIILHYLPRFQKEMGISDFYEKITGLKPTTLREFIARERHKMMPVLVFEEPMLES